MPFMHIHVLQIMCSDSHALGNLSLDFVLKLNNFYNPLVLIDQRLSDQSPGIYKQCSKFAETQTERVLKMFD